MASAATAHRPHPIVDLADVQLIDRTGSRPLPRTHEHAAADSHSLIASNVPAQAERLFRAAQAADRFLAP